MQQLSVPEELLIKIDYDSVDLPAEVQEFRPTVYRNGEEYCCLLGPDPELGIFGNGMTVREAVNNWVQDFKERLASPLPDDEVVIFIQNNRAINSRDVTTHVEGNDQ
ncbi:hypothetical protein [Paraflavitalea pollutisoli]|uniref:hypothetical protein n=1 Tax=Paraflavitalea pollutisoli TaxID=3034143 RepID=UPI0023ED5629|nr:hypothetical protein [Paraflavitalea sp. H1-2-19X]